jgi:hypothetical protein
MTDFSSPKNPRGKLLGDAGEHYALSQFSFAGKYAAKMPDNWEGYDLAVETGHGLVRVSVKTRSETLGWKSGSWFTFDDRKQCDWLVLIFKQSASLRSWVIPLEVALENANTPGPARKDPWTRDISWAKLNKAPLNVFENNWGLEPMHKALGRTSERLLAEFEGGCVHIAERNGEFLVIINEAALLDMLAPEDRDGFDGVRVLAFPSASARENYVQGRGWPSAL